MTATTTHRQLPSIEDAHEAIKLSRRLIDLEAMRDVLNKNPDIARPRLLAGPVEGYQHTVEIPMPDALDMLNRLIAEGEAKLEALGFRRA